MNRPVIRQATVKDTLAMTEIMLDAFASSYALFMPKPYIRQWLDADKAGITAHNAAGRGGLAEYDGIPVGFTVLEDDYMAELWVATHAQGLGAGKALVIWAETQALDRGFSSIHLHCYGPNTAALAFYTKMGFGKNTEFLSRHIPGGPVSVWTMSKHLRQE